MVLFHPCCNQIVQQLHVSCPQSILVQGTTAAVSLHYLPPVRCLFTFLPVFPPTQWPAAYPLVVYLPTSCLPTYLPTHPPTHLTGLWIRTYLTFGIVFLSGEKADVSTYLLVCQPVHPPPDLLTCLPTWGQGCLPFYTNQSGGNLVHYCKVYKIWRGGRTTGYIVYQNQLNRPKRIGKLHRLKLRPIFSEASHMKWPKPFDFPTAFFQFLYVNCKCPLPCVPTNLPADFFTCPPNDPPICLPFNS